MNPLEIIPKVLDAFSRGEIIRKIFSVFLKIIAVFIGLAGLSAIIMILKYAFQGDVLFIFAGILITVIVILFTAIAMQVIWYRGNDIRDLENSSFTLIPIISIYFRLSGELIAVMLLFFAIGGFVSLLFTGSDLVSSVMKMDLIPSLGLDSQFLNGLMLLFMGALMAFFSIVIGYWLAELTVVFADIAINIRKLAGVEEVVPSRSRTPSTQEYQKSYQRTVDADEL